MYEKILNMNEAELEKEISQIKADINKKVELINGIENDIQKLRESRALISNERDRLDTIKNVLQGLLFEKEETH